MNAKSWFAVVGLCAVVNSQVHARYYDAGSGRFISPDSVVSNPADPQDLNRYAYVRNDPVTNVDPSGHSWLSNHSFVAGAALQNFDLLSGTSLLAQTRQGQNYLAAQLIGATAVGGLGAGGAAQGIFQSAFWGEVNGAYSAYDGGGSILAGTVVGGVIGAATGYLSRSIGTTGIPNTQGSWEVANGQITKEVAATNFSPLEAVGNKFAGTLPLRAFGQGLVSGAGAGATSAYAGGQGSLRSMGSNALRGALRGAAVSTLVTGASNAFSSPGNLRGVPTGPASVNDTSGLSVSAPLRMSVDKGLSTYAYNGTFALSQSQNILTTGFSNGSVTFEAVPSGLYWLAR